MSSYKNIVVGTDGSDTSLRAVDRAGAIAEVTGAKLLIVSAYEPEPKATVKRGADALGADAYLVVGSAPAESVLRDAKARACGAGATNVDTLAVQSSPVEALNRAVAESGADLLVVGNVGLNTLTGRILGSVPQNVARKSGTDVLIVHTS
jgi:nucleotide-binding universal stress UspA family protein